MPKLSIIVPCFHKELKHYSLTMRCLEYLERNTIVPFDLIIVENVEKWCTDEGDKYFFSKEPKTFAENANIGLKMANTEYICVLNNDVLLPENWVEEVFKCFNDKDCGIATLDSTQYCRLPVDKIVEWFFGAMFVVKKEVVDKVGLFDETFRHAFDDADYWVRVYKAGYKILMNRNLQVIHADSATIQKMEGHNERYIAMRKKFNDKHKDCKLKIFEYLR